MRTPAQDRFDPYRVGLDHLALGVPDVMTLETMKRELESCQCSQQWDRARCIDAGQLHQRV